MNFSMFMKFIQDLISMEDQLKLNYEQINDMFEHIDCNQKGYITYDEFIANLDMKESNPSRFRSLTVQTKNQ